MGYEDQRHAALLLLRKQKIGDLAASFGIQVAGWLIGDQHRRRWSKGSSDRNALLFTAGQLARVVAEALAEPDGFQLLAGNVEGALYVGEFQWDGDIFEGRHVGDQMERLEDDADVLAPEVGKAVFTQRVQRRVADMDFTAVEPFETGQHHQKRRLARPGRPDDPHCLAFRDGKVDALQDVNGGCGIAQSEIGSFQFDDAVSHTHPSYICGD